MATEGKRGFFISYSHSDRQWAEWVAWQLEEVGYTTILQAWDFRPGGNFVLDMHRAAEQAERTIAVLSPSYLESSFTQSEWVAAFAQDPTGEKHLLVPVRVRECNPGGLLPQIAYIDLVGLEEAGARAALLAGVIRGRAKPEHSPAFPATPEVGIRAQPEFPGALPPIWNLPHRRNRNFTGRDDILAAIHDSVAKNHYTTLTQAITGLGGAGKTQLASEYAHRHVGDYDVIWWVGSEEPAQLAADYAALATDLVLPQRSEQDQRLIIAAVRHWLEHNSRWLLIFDNAPATIAVSDYLPRGGTGHVLITSRNQDWGAIAQPVPVPVLLRRESVAFLEKRTGYAGPELDTLADELGDLPLAMEQAAAYIAAAGCAVGTYLGLLHTRRQELWEHLPLPHDYPATVTTTWCVSMQQVQQECPSAVDLLRCCAYLAPDDVPFSIFRERAEHLPETLAAAVQDPIALNRALAVLRRYSLVEVHDDSLSLHRLVQAVIRDGLTAYERRTWAETAASIVAEAFPDEPDSIPSWPDYARLLPHALVTTGWAESLGVAIAESCTALNRAGMYLRERAELRDARHVLERALVACEEAYGSEHPVTAECASNLGMVLHDLGDLHEARAYLERALAVLDVTIGPEDTRAAMVANNLGRVLQDLGDLRGAQANLERALASLEEAYGPEHEAVAACAGNLGHLLEQLDDLQQARARIEQALSIGERTLGPDHPRVAHRLSNLGLVLQRLGDFAGARAQHERALAIYEKAYGPEHAHVATAAGNLSSVLRDLGDLPGARVHCERALGIHERTLGPEHPDVATTLNSFGVLLHEMGDLPGARACLERALAISERALGANHPTVAVRLGNLGSGLRDAGENEAALGCFERALEIDEKAYGQDDRRVASDLHGIALTLQQLGDLERARVCLERALVIDEVAYGANHREVARDLNNLGRVLKDLGELQEAHRCFGRALSILKSSVGPICLDVATTLDNLGNTLWSLGDLQAARARMDEARAIREDLLGPEHPEVGGTLGDLAAVHAILGDRAGARALLTRALRIFMKSLGEDHPKTVMTRKSLDVLTGGQR